VSLQLIPRNAIITFGPNLLAVWPLLLPDPTVLNSGPNPVTSFCGCTCSGRRWARCLEWCSGCGWPPPGTRGRRRAHWARRGPASSGTGSARCTSEAPSTRQRLYFNLNDVYFGYVTYVLFPLPSSLLPLPSSLFPLPSSLLPPPSSLFPLPSSLFLLPPPPYYGSAVLIKRLTERNSILNEPIQVFLK